MSHLMIDIETVGTGTQACILTIAAQSFDPFGTGYYDRQYYARVDIDSQPDRTVDDSTIEWWTSQPKESFNEAFGPENRISLEQALNELGKLIWQHKYIWANGPTFDMNILEDAYKSHGISLPWKYFFVRDARTVYSLYPALPKPATSHHALEDCRRQIDMLQQTFGYLGIEAIT